MGARTEGIASLLARLGEALATNPTQQAVAGVATEAITSVSQARGFNRGQEETSGRLLETLNEPRPAALQGGPGVNPLSIPGAPGTPPPATFESAGIAPPQRIDPFRAIALGQEGTQNLIRQKQQDKFLVQRGLEREQDFANRLKLIRETRKNQQELRDLQNQFEAERDVERGGPELRAAQLTAAQTTAGRAERTEAGAPTVKQLQEETALSLRGQKAQVLIAEAKQRLGTPAEEVVDPSDLATTRRLAETAIAPKILSTLIERLGNTEEVKKLNTFFDTPANLLDESARRTNFIALVSLLEPNELKELEADFGEVLAEIRRGGQPFNVVGLGGTLGAPAPISATNPAIDPIGTASVADAVAGARDPNSLLRRSGR